MELALRVRGREGWVSMELMEAGCGVGFFSKRWDAERDSVSAGLDCAL